MPIEIRITAESAGLLLAELGILAKLAGGQPIALPEDVDAATEAQSDDKPAARRGRPKKTVTIEGEVVKDAPAKADAVGVAGDATADAERDPGAGAAGGEAPGAVAAAQAEDQPAPAVDAVAGPLPTIEEVRKYVMETMAKHVPDLAARGERFRGMLDEFGKKHTPSGKPLAMLKELDPSLTSQFKAFVKEQLGADE